MKNQRNTVLAVTSSHKVAVGLVSSWRLRDCVALCRAYLLVVAFLPTACTKPASIHRPTASSDLLVISADEAKRIAMEKAEHTENGRLKVVQVELVRRRYWNVTTELEQASPALPLRSIVPATLSRSSAEFLVEKNVRERYGQRRFQIRPAQLVDARFWRVSIERFPRGPDSSFDLDVSTKTGEVIPIFTLNELFD